MDDLAPLLAALPRTIREPILHHGTAGLREVVLDLGRVPELRYDRGAVLLPGAVTREDIQYVGGRLDRFREDNRTGIERTLHRIACIRDRYGTIIGYTFRVGRPLIGAAGGLRDLLAGGKSILLLGAPGTGKTTLMRDAARILADDLGRKVVIVDTSNEIGGDGQIPHPAIGRARRLQIPAGDGTRPMLEIQAAILLQALANHTPEVIIVDELGFEEDARMARTIARRGVQLLATAHGRRLSDILHNPDLAGLLGGVHVLPLGAEEARAGTSRFVRERIGPPVFEVVVEVIQPGLVAVHSQVAESCDRILLGLPPHPELRDISINR
ncbi:MAG: AAA family ATPase [Armatimonadetes bacterium]|nr:AAA family ATPase [Armatimonadota bacterium]